MEYIPLEAISPNPCHPMPSGAEMVEAVKSLPPPLQWITAHAENLPADTAVRIVQLLTAGIDSTDVEMAEELDLDPVKLWIWQLTEGSTEYLVSLLITEAEQYYPYVCSCEYARKAVRRIELKMQLRQLDEMASWSDPPTARWLDEMQLRQLESPQRNEEEA